MLDWSPMEPVAGTGTCGFSGDGGPAIDAQVGQAEQVLSTGGGVVFLADNLNNRIRRFPIGGNIETVGGNGFTNYCGDVGSAEGFGIPAPPEGWNYSAINAAINEPRYVALLPDETVVWTEASNNIVRIMNPDGTIDTLAGSGQRGDADGFGRAAEFYRPQGLAWDLDGTLLVTETDGGNRVRRIDLATREVTTVAGWGTDGRPRDGDEALTAHLGRLGDVAVGLDGTIYVADPDNHCVFAIDGDGRIRAYVGAAGYHGDSGDGGLATAARLAMPYGLGLDEESHLYVTDFGTHRIRVVTPGHRPETATIEAFAGDGTTTYEGDGGDPSAAGFYLPVDVAIDPATGAVFISDQGRNAVRVVHEEDGRPILRTVAGTGACELGGDGGPASAATLCNPMGVAVDDTGGLYIADPGNNRIRYASFPW